MSFAENLDVFLAEFSVSCSKGGDQFAGILDMPDESLVFAGVTAMSTMYVLTLKTADSTRINLRAGDDIMANAIAFNVRELMLTDDGAFTKASLQR